MNEQTSLAQMMLDLDESAGFGRTTLRSCDILDGPGGFLEVSGDLIVECSLPLN
jgi:hypothetical protein